MSPADPSLPPWIGAASRLITRHGLATVFACVLLLLLVSKLPEVFADLERAQVAATAAVARTLDEHVDTMRARDREARDYERQSLILQLLTCIHTAPSRAGAELCRAVQR